jgi:hypothetical protein
MLVSVVHFHVLFFVGVTDVNMLKGLMNPSITKINDPVFSSDIQLHYRGVDYICFSEGRMKSSWTHLITPSLNFMEVR